MYAAGDVLGRPFLASTGVAQGVAAMEAMFGDNNKEVDDNNNNETKCSAVHNFAASVHTSSSLSSALNAVARSTHSRSAPCASRIRRLLVGTARKARAALTHSATNFGKVRGTWVCLSSSSLVAKSTAVSRAPVSDSC